MNDIDEYLDKLDKIIDALDDLKYSKEVQKDRDRLKAEEEAYDKWNKELNGKSCFMIGKYIRITLYFTIDKTYNNSCFDCFASLDENLSSEAYSLSFGSSSGFNEFVEDVIIPMVSSLVGETKYSHAFGVNDLSESITDINRFDSLCKDEKINDAKERFDGALLNIKSLSENKELGESADRLIECYFNEMEKLSK